MPPLFKVSIELRSIYYALRGICIILFIVNIKVSFLNSSLLQRDCTLMKYQGKLKGHSYCLSRHMNIHFSETRCTEMSTSKQKLMDKSLFGYNHSKTEYPQGSLYIVDKNTMK